VWEKSVCVCIYIGEPPLSEGSVATAVCLGFHDVHAGGTGISTATADAAWPTETR